MKLLLRWVLASVALFATIHVVPGLSPAGGTLMLLAATLALGLLNVLVRPALAVAKVLTFPLSCLTAGLWAFLLTLFVNVLLFYFVGSLEWGFRAENFAAAALGAVLMGVLNTLLMWLFEVGREDRK